MEDWNWITQIPFNIEDLFSNDGIQDSHTAFNPTAHYTTLPEQNTGGSGSRDCLLQGMEDGAQFTGQMLNTENIRPGFPSQNMDVQSNYLVIPPSISPTTLLDSTQAFLSNSIAQPSSSTGNFSHVPNGSSQSSFASPTFVPPYNQSNEDFFWDMNASSFGVSNEATPTNLHQPSYLSNQVLVQPEEVHPPQSLEHSKYSTLNQHMDLSKMDAIGVNFLNQNTYYNVGAYKGFHNHPKPLPGQNISLQPSCVLNNMLLETGAPSGTGTSTYTGGDPVWQHDNHGLVYGNRDMSLCEQNGMQLNSGNTLDGSSPFSYEDNDDRVTRGSVSLGRNGEGDESDSKKRKTELSNADMSDPIQPMRGPRVVVQTISDVDIVDDGYRWRKYGQKKVKGNPNPRSYYKCTSAGCCVKKQIERSADDQNMVITTFDGKHNHEVPTARNNRHNYSSLYNDHLNQSTNHVPKHMQINESYQVHSSMTQFNEIPPLGSFAINPRDLSNHAIGRMQANQGQLPVLPNHQFLGQQGTMNVRSLMLPQEEPRVEHASNPLV